MTSKRFELVSGMIAKTRSNELFCFFACDDAQSFFFNNKELIPLSCYNNELISKKSRQDDIIEIYRSPNNFLEDFQKVCEPENKVFERETDWSTVAIDSKVLIRNEKSWDKMYFAKYSKGKIYVFADGGTSYSQEDNVICINKEDIILYKDDAEETNAAPIIDSGEYRDIPGFSRYKMNVKGRIVRKAYIYESEYVPEAEICTIRNKNGFMEVTLTADDKKKKKMLLLNLLEKTFPAQKESAYCNC